MTQNFNFRLLRGHWFFAKNGSYGYGANYGGDPLGSILGPMGSHWVQKMGQNRKKLPCPKIRIFDYPAFIDFSQKNGSYGYGAKSRLGPPRVHFGANGVPLGPKNGSKPSKIPCPKLRIFDYPAVIDFSQKMEVTVMASNHGGDRLGSILGPMGSHWVQKMGQSRKKLPCPNIRIFDYPAVIDFFTKNGSYGYGAKSRLGPPRVHLGPMRSYWVKKIGQNRI